MARSGYPGADQLTLLKRFAAFGCDRFNGIFRFGVSPLRLLVAVMAFLICTGTQAQPGFANFFNDAPRLPILATPEQTHDAEFTFARLIYGTSGGMFSRRTPWLTDWPEAETFFLQGIGRLTQVDAAGTGRAVSLSDTTIFDYPWLYAVEVGKWSLTPDEAATLREYLLRGGLLMVDDFHGSYEWDLFANTLRSVFPDRPIVEIPDHDAILNLVYPLDKSVQIPGVRSINSGQTWEQDGYVPTWRGVYDDHNRLMVVINFNMDLGDAWEHADNPRYPEHMTSLAYRFAVNYLIYAMSH